MFGSRGGPPGRLKESRLVQAAVVFLGASWVVLQIVDMMIERKGTIAAAGGAYVRAFPLAPPGESEPDPSATGGR